MEYGVERKNLGLTSGITHEIAYYERKVKERVVGLALHNRKNLVYKLPTKIWFFDADTVTFAIQTHNKQKEEN